MDLYFQIGVLFVIAAAFTFIVGAYSETIDRSASFHDDFEVLKTNGFGEQYYGAEVLTVDHRSLYAWATNIARTREVFLVNLNSLTIPTSLEKNTFPVALTIPATHSTGSEVVINRRSDGFIPNAMKVNLTSSEMHDYIKSYAAAAKDIATNGILTVYQMSRENEGEALFVVVAK